MALTAQLAHRITETTYEQLPPMAVTQAKRALLDTIGVTLAGHREEAGRIITLWVQDAGGSQEATVLGTALYTSPALAALANGTLGHCLDFDDVTAHLRGHPSVVVAPVVLALGEALGASGTEVLTAFVLGIEVEAKIGKAMTSALPRHGWHPTAVIGTLGATAAAAKMLALEGTQIQAALGIAASKAGGLRQNFGTMTKPLHAGEAARTGVEAAQLAQRGFTADRHILEERFGFFNTFVGAGEFDLDVVLQDFGAPYEIVSPGIGVKPYPSCRQTHRGIDAMLELVHRHHLQADEVSEIVCEMSARAQDFLIHHRPQTGLEGKFSMEYCMAAALLHGQMGLAQFSDASVQDPRVQALLQRVRFEHPDQDAADWETPMPDIIKVVLHDGRHVQQRVDIPQGDPELPLSWDALVAKFQDCAAGVLEVEQVQEAVQHLAHLEDLPTLQPLMATLTRVGVTA
ncbi:MAG TPA: MmgE/PrpD family protein [Candidatus Tectomicrobia bacterium]|jgi:2-methylcitrate dehydratase PrpD